MNRVRAILLLAPLTALIGGCDGPVSSRPAGMVPRADYDRAAAEAGKEKSEAARYRAEAEQLRQTIEQARRETGKIFNTLKEQEEAKTQRLPALERANLDLVAQVHRLQGQVQELKTQLADARRQYQTLQRENQLLRMVMAQSGRLAAATQPAPVAAADPEERSRLLAQAEEELRQAKAALEKLETVMGSPASMPATADAPPGKKAIRGAVLVVRGATVVIDIGSQDGLRKDTPLEVYRGEQFIGVLRLTAVGENTAEGLLDGRVGANEGDKVVEGEKATGGRE